MIGIIGARGLAVYECGHDTEKISYGRAISSDVFDPA